MQFLCNSRIPKGVSREQVVEHLKRDEERDAERWELLKKGGVAQWVYKVGDEPGITLILNCADIEEAHRLMNAAPAKRAGILEFEIDPVEFFLPF